MCNLSLANAASKQDTNRRARPKQESNNSNHYLPASSTFPRAVSLSITRLSVSSNHRIVEPPNHQILSTYHAELSHHHSHDIHHNHCNHDNHYNHYSHDNHYNHDNHHTTTFTSDARPHSNNLLPKHLLLDYSNNLHRLQTHQKHWLSDLAFRQSVVCILQTRSLLYQFLL
jgi:hypothetical protein